MDIARKKEIYEKKKLLQISYEKWYTKILANLKTGKTLEIGSGFGLSKKYIDCITSEFEKNDFVDRAEDACHLNFDSGTLENIIGIDVLHHLYSQNDFFNEAYRVLHVGGRVIFIEPYISPFSFFIRRYFHHEPMNFEVVDGKISKNPEDSNLALPTLLIRNKLIDQTRFKIVKIEKSDFLSYLLSLGFRDFYVVPNFLSNFIAKLDNKIMKFSWISNIFAFKVLIVLEKI